MIEYPDAGQNLLVGLILITVRPSWEPPHHNPEITLFSGEG
jgi:hypothetical protein